MKSAITLVALLAALGAQAAAAQPYATPPPVSAPRPLALPAPFVQTLANGLRVIVAPRTTLPLVTAELVLRSGTEADPEALSGLADLTATLLTKGTARRTAPQIAEAAEALGGQLDSGAGWHRSFVSITVTRPQLPAALDLVADVTLHPRFANAELERARRLAIDGLNVALAQPGTLARLVADRAAFGASTYGHPAGGTPASLARVRRADVIALHAQFYRPDNATLIFAGDIDPKDAVALAQVAFGRWARPATPLPASPVGAAQPVARSPLVIAMPGAGQAGVAMAMPTIARSAPDYYAGQVANTLLGGGYSSRLNQEIRIKRGLSYSVHSHLDARRAGGTFSMAAQTKNASAPEVVTVMLDEIGRMGTTPADADELAARKLALIGGFSRSLETTEDLAGRLGALEANGVDLAELGRTIGKMEGVSATDVQTFAKAHWQPGDLRIVVAGDAPQFVDALRKAYPELLVIPQAEVDLDSATLVKAARTAP